MSASDIPPFDGCKGYVIIGYSVKCGSEGDSAGFDTQGESGRALLRVSVGWKPESLSNEPRFYLGYGSRGQRHVPSVEQNVNIDTWFEVGNQNSGGRNDDTQDIADQQAAEVEAAEQNGDIPEDMVEIETDGGPRGDCHARIKIWCPDHIDIGGHGCSKAYWFGAQCGDFPVELKPAPDPRIPGPGGWDPIQPGDFRGGGIVPIKPGVPIGKGKGGWDPYLDPPNRQLPEVTKRPIKPADPERGRALRRDSDRRMGRPPRTHGIEPSNGRLHNRSNYGIPESETIVMLGGPDAVSPDAWMGVDTAKCRAVKVLRASSPSAWLALVTKALTLLGARVIKSNGGIVVKSGLYGAERGVIALVVSGDIGIAGHLIMERHASGSIGQQATAVLEDASEALKVPGLSTGSNRGCCSNGWCACHGVVRLQPWGAESRIRNASP